MTDKTVSPLVPAATVVLLRDSAHGLEALLVQRSQALRAFAAIWAFPGGRIEPQDAPETGYTDPLEIAKTAAIRECYEEIGLSLDTTHLHSLSKWIPPEQEKKRFETWFFIAPAPDQPLQIDGFEICAAKWVQISDFIARLPHPDYALMPPTYVSLYHLAGFTHREAALSALQTQPMDIFETRLVKTPEAFITLWTGDAAYNQSDIHAKGARRRLTMSPDCWSYETDFMP